MRLSILCRIMEIEEGVITLQDLHNSSYDTNAEFNNLLFYYSFKIVSSLHVKTWLKHSYLHWSIDVKFTFDGERLGFSAQQIFSK